MADPPGPFEPMADPPGPFEPPADRPGLFDEVVARGAVRHEVSDRAWLSALLRTEVALAVAQAALGLIPHGAASAIASAAHPERFDLTGLAYATTSAGNPVLPLVSALRAALPE